MNRTDTRTPKLIRHTAIAAVLASLAMMLTPAMGLAKAPVRFGARLNSSVQPSNSLPGLKCGPEPGTFYPCTMVQNEAYGRPNGGEIAPKTGTIKTIRLIAGGPGTMRVETDKVKRSTLFGTNEAKLVHKGPKVSYEGQTEANWENDSYRVESFRVDMPISRGEQLSIHTNGTSMIRCSSGGQNTLIYSLAYYPKHPFNAAEGTDGCWLLMEAIYK